MEQRLEQSLQNYPYSVWLTLLRTDAHKMGCYGRSFAAGSTFWQQVYQEGVQPTIRAVIDWCLLDPERFLDAQVTVQPVRGLEQVAA